MTISKYICILVIGFLMVSCKEAKKEEVREVKITEITMDSLVEPPPPPVPAGLKVAAYLIYNDSTVSAFDILNDKTIALWNVIAGGGDAEKPSNQTKIVLTGKLDSLKLTIRNGKRKAADQEIPDFSGVFGYVIENTGCNDVKVVVTKSGKIVYSGEIPFRCGE